MELTTNVIDTTTVMNRYGIKSRTTLNDWFERAGVESFRQGKYTFIHSYQLNALDALAREMGRPINYSAGSEPETYEPIIHASEFQEITETSQIDLLPIAREFESLPDLAKWYAAHLVFEQLAAHQIIIPREPLLVLLNKKRLPRHKEGYFAWGNFKFHRTNSGWTVER